MNESNPLSLQIAFSPETFHLLLPTWIPGEIVEIDPKYPKGCFVRRLISLTYPHGGAIMLLKCSDRKGMPLGTLVEFTQDNGGATPGGVEVADKQVLRRIVEGIENRPYIRGAVYYHCPDCNEFWVLQRCTGIEHHPILKFGEQSFHARSRTHPDEAWLNICPQCGSDFPAEGKKINP